MFADARAKRQRRACYAGAAPVTQRLVPSDSSCAKNAVGRRMKDRPEANRPSLTSHTAQYQSASQVPADRPVHWQVA